MISGDESRQDRGCRYNATRILVEGGISIALASVLSLVRIYRMPQGGEVSLVMVPLILFALLRGTVPGFLAGLSFGLLHFLQTSFAVHPLQVLLDYPLAYGAVGLAGFASGKLNSLAAVMFSVLAAFAGRFMFHVMSGCLFISLLVKNVPGNPLLYSVVYNGAYLVPDAILCIVVVMLVLPRLKRAII